MKVGLLTLEQKNEITGQQFAPDSYFNPIQDINGQWIISLEEVNQCSIEWVKELPLIEYEPVIFEDI